MKDVSERASLRSDGAKAGEALLARTKSSTRCSRELPTNLQRIQDEHASHYVIEAERGPGYAAVADFAHFDPEKLFGRRSPLTIGIGSGTGEQIVEAAHTHLDRDYLTFEAWVPGIAKLISKAVGTGMKNIRVVEADIQLALPTVFDEAIAQEVWAFLPDPWRKTRHHKHCLVSADLAPETARVLEDGGLRRLAIDWDDYAWQMRDVIKGCELFKNPYEGERSDPNDPEPSRNGFAPRFSGRVETHFETRGVDAGRRAHDLVAMRLPHEGASSEDE